MLHLYAAGRRLFGGLALLALATTAQAQTTTFGYTGTPQTYTVPAGITAVQVVATGASGGVYAGTNYSYGARVQATLTVTPGEVLTVQVGGRGGFRPGGNPGGGGGTPGGGGGGGQRRAPGGQRGQHRRLPEQP